MTQHTDPCHQHAPISALTEAVGGINVTLSQLVKGQTEMVDLLKGQAAQVERNKSTDEKLTKLEKSDENLFSRMRDVEIKVEGTAVRVGVISAVSAVIGGGVVAAALKALKLG